MPLVCTSGGRSERIGLSWPWTFIVGFVLPISGVFVLIGLFNLAARLRPTDRFAFKREWLRDGAVAVLPLAIAGTLAALTFIWDPDGTQFPSVEFYVVGAEILALLLIALILERETIRGLKGWLRLEYALILLAGEGAALTRVADVVQEPSAWAEGTFSVLTTSALINTVTLVLFAFGARTGHGISRKEARSPLQKVAI
jgi:hypothetical protein